MTTFSKEKSPGEGSVHQGKPRKYITDRSEVCAINSSINSRIDQDIALYRAGYNDAWNELAPRIAQLENALSWYVKRSVEDMFAGIGFDGSQNARHRSAQKFWNEYNQRCDAA